MSKYVYIAPQSYIMFLIGRSAPRMLAGCLSFIITLGFGIGILGIPVNLLHVNYLLLLLALVPGFVAIMALGIALAGISLVLKQNAWILPDAMAGALYLIAGAIFPIAILPGWLGKIALVMPLTYWLELIRRALLGETIGAVFPVASTPAIVGLLVLTTSLALIACIAIFRASEHLARERGQIDHTTNY